MNGAEEWHPFPLWGEGLSWPAVKQTKLSGLKPGFQLAAFKSRWVI